MHTLQNPAKQLKIKPTYGSAAKCHSPAAYIAQVRLQKKIKQDIEGHFRKHKHLSLGNKNYTRKNIWHQLYYKLLHFELSDLQNAETIYREQGWIQCLQYIKNRRIFINCQ